MPTYQDRQHEASARQEIVRVCHLMWEKGYVAATDGNVSMRLGDRILTTPSGLSKGMLDPEQLVLTDLDGKALPAWQQTCKGLMPSSELRIHCEAYRRRPDIGAVVHAHPPVALAFSIAGVSLAGCVLPEVVLTLGAIPTTRYATPTSAEGPEVIRDLIGKFDALILDRHGTVTVGKDPLDAYFKLEKIEHSATVTLAARQLGEVRTLPPEEVRRLTAIRRQTLGLPPEWDGEGCVQCGACGRSKDGAAEAGCTATACSAADGDEALVERITRAVLRELGGASS
jgi:L-fuculose-phosphate aldolase